MIAVKGEQNLAHASSVPTRLPGVRANQSGRPSTRVTAQADRIPVSWPDASGASDVHRTDGPKGTSMSRGSRVLTAMYTAVALWLAYCTVRTWGAVPAWTTLAMAAASLAPVLGVVRETVIADERRAVAVLREREGRRAAWRDVAAAAVARAEVEAACCERWWTSCASEHDPNCAHRTSWGTTA
jgi:hypothetical protein